MLWALYCRLVLASLTRPLGRSAIAATMICLLALIGLPVRLGAAAGAAPVILLPGAPVALAAGAPGRLYLATDEATGVLALDDAGPAVREGAALTDSIIGAVAADTAAGRVYVADLALPGLRVLDGASAEIAIIDLPQLPVGLAVAPAGRVFVVTRKFGGSTAPDALVLVDGTRAAILATVPIGAGPLALAADPMTSRVYVADAGSNTLAVLDGATLARLATLPLGYGPHALAVDGRAGRVYASNRDDGTLTVLDGAHEAVLATVAIGDSPGALAADERTHRVYVIIAGGRVAVLDGLAGRLLATVAVSRRPAALAVDEATGRVYVGGLDGSLWRIADRRLGCPIARLIARTAEPPRRSPPDAGDHGCQ